MTSLPARLETLNFSTQLVELKNIMETCDPGYSFWGGRIIRAKGMCGSYNLNLLYDKVYTHACKRAEIGDLTVDARIVGVDIVKKLSDFYKETNDQLNKANFLTRFFRAIREFSFGLSSPQSLELDFCFRAFKKEKFKELFGEEPVEWSRTSKSNCQGSYRGLFFAFEKDVRNLASHR